MKKIFKSIVLIISLVSLVNANELEKQWEVSGFSMPESIVASPNSSFIYISNVNAKESGYISRLTKDGKVDSYKWIEGLNNPAGLALFEDKLYVGDSTGVHIIDVKKEKLIKTISSKEAKALNDVTISKEGRVFISDIATGKIFTIENDKLALFFEVDEIKHPNGLFVQDNHLFIADFASKLSHDLKVDNYGSVYKVSLFTKSFRKIPSSHHLGGLDGLVSLNNALLVSSNPSGELFAITDKERVLIKSFEKGLADISISEETLFAPFIFSGKVSSYSLKGLNITSTTIEKWTSLRTKKAFLENVADKYFGDESGKSIATKDGKIKGNFGGKELKGTWEWKDEYFCRKSTLGKQDLGEDCIAIEVTSSQMRLKLEKGKGISVVYDKQ